MLKLRLKRVGRKRAPSYRLVLMESNARRDGRAVEELGWYNPITKKYAFHTLQIQKRLGQGVQPTQTVLNLLKKTGITQKV